MSRDPRPLLEIVVPVLDEELLLPQAVSRIRAFAREQMGGWSVRVCIADNGSTDRTPAIARELALASPEVRVLRIAAAGRGGALRAAWTSSEADVLAYTDVDLSADLAALPRLASLVQGGVDIAIGSRHRPDSQVTRSALRGVLSRGYNGVVRALFGVGFDDAQCGFKAISPAAAAFLLPCVRDDGWFFDTELLILAERAGLRIGEVGLRWVEGRHSRVRIVPTAVGDLRGLLRLRLGGLRRAVLQAGPWPGARSGQGPAAD